MKQIFSILIILILIFGFFKSFGQTTYSNFNQSVINFQKKSIQNYCPSFGSPKTISKKIIQNDKSRLVFLNSFYNKDLTPKDIYTHLNKFFRHKWRFDTTNLGAVTKYTTRIYSEGNLELFISFSIFKHNIVFKRIYFYTKSKTDCKQPYQFAILPIDIKYLEAEIIPIADFPFSYCETCRYISCDTVFFEKLKKMESTDFKLFLNSNDIELNNLTWFRIDKYQMINAENEIVQIVKQRNFQLLEKLLYSPNYVLSIYAMEGLIYLREIMKFEISLEIQQKMEQVKNADIKIVWQNFDVVRSGLTYKELKISKEKIFSKFRGN